MFFVLVISLSLAALAVFLLQAKNKVVFGILLMLGLGVAVLLVLLMPQKNSASVAILRSKLVAGELSLSNHSLKNISSRALQDFFQQNAVHSLDLQKIDLVNAEKLADKLPEDINLTINNLLPQANQAFLQKLASKEQVKHNKITLLNLTIDQTLASSLLTLLAKDHALSVLSFDKVSFQQLPSHFWDNLLPVTVRDLSIKNSALDDQQLSSLLSVLAKHPQVTQLNLWGNAFGDKSVPALRAYMQGVSLEILNLGHNRFSLEQLILILQTFRDNSKIANLQLSNNNLSEDLRFELRSLNAQRQL